MNTLIIIALLSHDINKSRNVLGYICVKYNVEIIDLSIGLPILFFGHYCHFVSSHYNGVASSRLPDDYRL